MAGPRKGKFKPRNPSKYAGNPNEIIYRSGWERQLMSKFDQRDDVVYWSSEEFYVPYYDPVNDHWRRYFPDFIVKVKTKDGGEKTFMIEVKPYKQTQEPTKPKRKSKRYLNEVATFGINKAKWEAAEKFCKKKDWQFKIVTEKDIKF
ncbi:TnsA endonuclease N-terminal domain-containing protein [Methanohalobium sp.]|uniref:TnsA endonuclease N-terminal domain-containing protein n=1 Tax=Methanohalobium sp. TaxID=2837493 RepID=UPI0025DD8D5E|nr:TnsA endonuclease N-terminal domain-containing protein [Methanohalobium sp.]